jgi:hypothetical protein
MFGWFKAFINKLKPAKPVKPVKSAKSVKSPRPEKSEKSANKGNMNTLTQPTGSDHGAMTLDALFYKQLQQVTARIHETENIEQIM